MIIFNGATEEVLLSNVHEIAGMLSPMILFHGSNNFFHYLLSFIKIFCDLLCHIVDIICDISTQQM